MLIPYYLLTTRSTSRSKSLIKEEMSCCSSGTVTHLVLSINCVKVYSTVDSNYKLIKTSKSGTS